MKGLEEWLSPVSAGTKTGLQIAQVNSAMLLLAITSYNMPARDC